MMTLRRANERGHANHGWLDSYHTFSFGSYYDPKHMGVSALRVINDDSVDPGQGFATHGHEDMEIISFVKSGIIAHKDSMGNVQTLPAGEFQLMSAGTGVTHSEYNPSDDEQLKFLQIWIQPNRTGVEPGYQQKRFAESPMQLVISPDGEDGSLSIHQDAKVYHVTLGANEDTQLEAVDGRTLYLHVIEGDVDVMDDTLTAGDAASIDDINTFKASSKQGAEALLFDLP